MSLKFKNTKLTRYLNQLIEARDIAKHLSQTVSAAADESDDDESNAQPPTTKALLTAEARLKALIDLVARTVTECETVAQTVVLNEENKELLRLRLAEASEECAEDELLALDLRVAIQIRMGLIPEVKQQAKRDGSPYVTSEPVEEVRQAPIEPDSEAESDQGQNKERTDPPKVRQKGRRSGKNEPIQTPSPTLATLNKGGAIYVNLEDIRTRLPQIEIPKFSGNIWQWDDFWTLFESNVASKSITDLEKFHHLLNALSGEAKETVKRFRLTNENYALAVAKLKEKFCNDTAIVDELYFQMQRAKALGTSARAQRELLEELKSLMEQLEHRGETAFGSHFARQLLAKFEDKIQRQVFKKHTRAGLGNAWDLTWVFDTIDDCLTVEVEIERMMRKDHCRDVDHSERELIKGPREGEGCFLCFGDHKAAQCETVTDPNERENILKDQKRCLNCFQKGHFVGTCTNLSRCRWCHRKHNTLVCRVQTECSEHQMNSGSRPNDVLVNRTQDRLQMEPQSQRQPVFPENTEARPFTTQNREMRVVTAVTAIDSDSIELRNEVNTMFTLESDETPRKRAAVVLVGAARVWNLRKRKLSKIPVLLDTGSNVSFIDEGYSKDIGAKVIEERRLKVTTFGGKASTTVKEVVGVTLFDEQDEAHSFQLFKKEVMTAPLAQPQLTKNDWHFIRENSINLSLPPKEHTVTPRILIGMDQMHKILPMDFTLPTGLQLMSTKLGFVIGGQQTVNLTDSDSFVTEGTTMMVSGEETHENEYKNSLLKRVQEELNVETLNEPKLSERLKTQTNIEAMTNQKVWRNFKQSIERRNEGYYVKFPWKEHQPYVPDNYPIAKGRLSRVLLHMNADKDVCKAYDEVFSVYQEKEILEEIDLGANTRGFVQYLAHHPTITSYAEYRRMRVIFDTMTHFEMLPSLHEMIHEGPAVIPDIPMLLMKFRLSEIVVFAEIENAFMQMGLHERDRNACRCLWVKDPQSLLTPDNLRVFRFKRVPSVVGAAPFLFVATIRHHVKETVALSETMKIELIESLFVDQLMMTAATTHEVLSKLEQAKEFFRELNMELSDVSTNDEQVKDCLEVSEMKFKSVPKVFGIPWCSETDSIRFEVKYVCDEPITRKSVARQLHAVFDPLGWFLPILREGLCFLRELMTNPGPEDEPLSDEKAFFWKEFMRRTSCSYSFPRMMAARNEHVKLAVFSYASIAAIVSCAYLVGRQGTRLLKAKTSLHSRSRVLDTELQAMTMAVKEGLYLVRGLRDNVRIDGVYVFSGSISCLSLIRDSTRVTPVSDLPDRVSEIRSHITGIECLVQTVKVGFVCAEDNPAVYGSRGFDPSMNESFLNHIWWIGPQFLRDPENLWSGKCEKLFEAVEIVKNDEVRKEGVTSRVSRMAKTGLLIPVRTLRWMFYYCRAVLKLLRAVGVATTEEKSL